MAQSGLITKGVVYLVLGTIVILQAINIQPGNTSADKTGVLQSLYHSFAGKWLLPLLIVGLCCYVLWRVIQAIQLGENFSENWKKVVRYFFSALVYGLFAYSAIQMVVAGKEKNGDSQQELAAELMSKPFGEWLLGIAALALAGVGIYQVWYGLSKKYRKHVDRMNLHSRKASILLSAGMIGYPARGIVWLLIAYLLLRAAITGSSEKAGDTDKALHWAQGEFGIVVLVAIAVGLIAYGIFNFIRAAYENLEPDSSR